MGSFIPHSLDLEDQNSPSLSSPRVLERVGDERTATNELMPRNDVKRWTAVDN